MNDLHDPHRIRSHIHHRSEPRRADRGVEGGRLRGHSRGAEERLVSRRSPAARHHSRLHSRRRDACRHPHRPSGQIAARPAADRRRLKAKGAHLYATEQPVDTSTAAGKAFFDMLGVFAEFETNLRRERQAEGIASSQKARHLQGPAAEDRSKRNIRQRLKQGHGPTQIARDLGISRGTVYQVRKGQMTKAKAHNPSDTNDL